MIDENKLRLRDAAETIFRISTSITDYSYKIDKIEEYLESIAEESFINGFNSREHHEY